MTEPGQLVALIPARGGSKRLPGKNTLMFFGHPMLAYAVAAALNTGIFANVIVSSEDPLVGRAAEWYGAEYVARPTELATDTASLADVARHVCQTLAERGVQTEALCQIMPNCPLVRSADILEHYRLLREGNRAFQISVVPYRGVYPQWALLADGSWQGNWLFGSEHVVRSQELKSAFCPSGAIWWVRTVEFFAQGSFYGSPFYLAPIDANRGMDIDDEEDLRLAEILVHGLWAQEGSSPLEPLIQKPFAGARN